MALTFDTYFTGVNMIQMERGITKTSTYSLQAALDYFRVQVNEVADQATDIDVRCSVLDRRETDTAIQEDAGFGNLYNIYSDAYVTKYGLPNWWDVALPVKDVKNIDGKIADKMIADGVANDSNLAEKVDALGLDFGTSVASASSVLNEDGTISLSVDVPELESTDSYDVIATYADGSEDVFAESTSESVITLNRDTTKRVAEVKVVYIKDNKRKVLELGEVGLISIFDSDILSDVIMSACFLPAAEPQIPEMAHVYAITNSLAGIAIRFTDNGGKVFNYSKDELVGVFNKQSITTTEQYEALMLSQDTIDGYYAAEVGSMFKIGVVEYLNDFGEVILTKDTFVRVYGDVFVSDSNLETLDLGDGMLLDTISMTEWGVEKQRLVLRSEDAASGLNSGATALLTGLNNVAVLPDSLTIDGTYTDVYLDAGETASPIISGSLDLGGIQSMASIGFGNIPHYGTGDKISKPVNTIFKEFDVTGIAPEEVGNPVTIEVLLDDNSTKISKAVVFYKNDIDLCMASADSIIINNGFTDVGLHTVGNNNVSTVLFEFTEATTEELYIHKIESPSTSLSLIATIPAGTTSFKTNLLMTSNLDFLMIHSTNGTYLANIMLGESLERNFDSNRLRISPSCLLYNGFSQYGLFSMAGYVNGETSSDVTLSIYNPVVDSVVLTNISTNEVFTFNSTDTTSTVPYGKYSVVMYDSSNNVLKDYGLNRLLVSKVGIGLECKHGIADLSSNIGTYRFYTDTDTKEFVLTRLDGATIWSDESIEITYSLLPDLTNPLANSLLLAGNNADTEIRVPLPQEFVNTEDFITLESAQHGTKSITLTSPAVNDTFVINESGYYLSDIEAMEEFTSVNAVTDANFNGGSTFNYYYTRYPTETNPNQFTVTLRNIDWSVMKNVALFNADGTKLSYDFSAEMFSFQTDFDNGYSLNGAYLQGTLISDDSIVTSVPFDMVLK